jgi:hypothetical protein
MAHQKDFRPPQSFSPDKKTLDQGQNDAALPDSPDQALEEGDVRIQGRTRGQIIGQEMTGLHDGSDLDFESGRHKSTPEY